jgi:hypothetical protein
MYSLGAKRAPGVHPATRHGHDPGPPSLPLPLPWLPRPPRYAPTRHAQTFVGVSAGYASARSTGGQGSPSQMTFAGYVLHTVQPTVRSCALGSSKRTLHSAAASACSAVRRASSASRADASARAALSSAASSASAAPLASCLVQTRCACGLKVASSVWFVGSPRIVRNCQAVVSNDCAGPLAQSGTTAIAKTQLQQSTKAAPGEQGRAAGPPPAQQPPRRGRRRPACQPPPPPTPACPATAAPPLPVNKCG